MTAEVLELFENPLYPPSSIQAEQALLGAILINNDALYRVHGFLEAEYFSEHLHQEIYSVCEQRITAGHKVDPVLIKSFLPENEKIGDITIAQYLALLAAEAVTIINAYDYGKAVCDLHIRRRLFEYSSDVLKLASNAPVDTPASEIVTELTSMLINIGGEGQHEISSTSAAAIANQALEETSQAYQNKEVRGVPLPLPELETVNQGILEAGNLYGLLGGTKEGKSSLTGMLIHKALSYDCPVLVLSYDQTGVQWMRQMAAQQVGVDGNKQRKGEITPEEYELLDQTMREFGKMPLEIIKCGQEGPDRLVAYATRFLRKFKKSNQVPLIVLDHVGKVTPVDPRADAGKQAGQSNQKFKAFAGEHDCVWFNLVQRNGAGMSRNNPRPIKKDVYGAEGAVADYDALFYVYREEKWRRDQLKTAEDRHKADIGVKIEKRKGLAEIGLVAHRFAPEHVKKDLKFIPHLTRFESIEEDQPEFGL